MIDIVLDIDIGGIGFSASSPWPNAEGNAILSQETEMLVCRIGRERSLSPSMRWRLRGGLRAQRGFVDAVRKATKQF